MLYLPILQHTNWACSLSAAPWITPLYVLYIQFCTIAYWESPLQSAGLSGCCWKSKKSFFIQFAHKGTSCQLPALQPLLTRLLLWSVMYCNGVRFCEWQLTLDMVGYAHYKSYLQILFAQNLEGGKPWREGRGTVYSLHLNGNIFRSRWDKQYSYHVHRSTCEMWSDYQVKNVHLP